MDVSHKKMEKTDTEPQLKMADFGEGEILSLDEGDVFLRDNNLTPAYVQGLLADKDHNKRLVRKIDLILLPLLAGTYVLQYIDKSALAYSAVFDLLPDTNTSLYQYSWLGSIFYFAYMFAEYPWSYLSQRTSMAKVVAGCIIAWGCILMTTAACTSFTGLALCRFFLGVFEAPITPCFMMIVGMWYTRQEQPFRAGVFYCCNGVGSMIGGVLTYCIGQVDSYPVWKLIFLICGGVTIVWGCLVLWLLPDNIISAKKFSLEDKAILIGRAKLGRTGVLNRTIKWYQIKEALLDPQILLLAFYMLLNEVINGGIANFGKLIIKGLVKKPLLATALAIPQGGFQVFWILSGTFVASRYKNLRTIIMVMYLLPTIIGACLLWKAGRQTQAQKIGVLFGYYISGSYVAGLVLALQMPTTNTGGYTKRTTGVAVVFMSYCIGNIIGPHAFIASEAPTYPTGCKVLLACSVTQAAIALGLRALLIARNKKRDATASAGTNAEFDAIGDASGDLTDFENRNFRYVY